jgi:hypothetical protein
MPVELPRDCLRLINHQDGVLTTGQAIAAGLTVESVRNQLRAGRWQAMHRGVYAASNGAATRRAELWAALLRAGPDAVFSHQTAAELYGLHSERERGRLIHITVPHDRNPGRHGRIPGVVIHRSRSLTRTRHPVLTPPRTRLEDTVLDLIECSRDFDDGYAWICRAIGRRLTTADRLLAAARDRPRIRWRHDIELALGYASGGALSRLELRYLRGVEMPHGLPVAQRQVLVRQATGNRYLDNLYDEYRACVEIDGTAAHPEDEQWRDKYRDRWNSVHAGIETIRIGVPDLLNRRRQCQTAADVARWLTGRGPATGRPCADPGCPVPALGVAAVGERH